MEEVESLEAAQATANAAYATLQTTNAEALGLIAP
jgi:hypothetical protein